MSLSKESIKRLRAVKRAILAEPKFYNQDIPPWQCATTCCMAGWAMWLDNPRTYKKRVADDPSLSGWRTRGSEALGLTACQTNNLFSFGDAWPGPLGRDYRNAVTPAERAAVAAARIEHFIKTGGAE